jgi:DNA adenine methylase
LKPLFKWSGGKSKEIPVVNKYKPHSFNIYFEPFVGGGAVWLHLNNPNNIVGDNFVELINFYQSVKTHKEKIIDFINNVVNTYNNEVIKLEKLPLAVWRKREFDKIANEFYYRYRDNDFNGEFENALKFYLLRQLSFSGMLRFSQNGKFNIPFGWYRRIKILDYDKDLYKLLDNTKFILGEWSDAVEKATQEDFVFLDPPYTRKFQQYSPYGIFGDPEHIKLSRWFKEATSRSLIILNKDDFTYGLYSDYIVEEYNKRYSIQYRHRMKPSDSNSIHFVAINY